MLDDIFSLNSMITSVDQLSNEEVVAVVRRMNGPEKGRQTSFGIDPGLSPMEAITEVTRKPCYVADMRQFVEELHQRLEQITGKGLTAEAPETN